MYILPLYSQISFCYLLACSIKIYQLSSAYIFNWYSASHDFIEVWNTFECQQLYEIRWDIMNFRACRFALILHANSRPPPIISIPRQQFYLFIYKPDLCSKPLLSYGTSHKAYALVPNLHARFNCDLTKFHDFFLISFGNQFDEMPLMRLFVSHPSENAIPKSQNI